MMKNYFYVLILIALTGCSPWSKFPVLNVERASDSTQNCDVLDDEILKANALRDAVLQERSMRRAALGAETAANVALNPASIGNSAIYGAKLAYAESGYKKSEASASARMVYLLALKKTNSCKEAVTASLDLHEYEILSEIESLDRELEENLISGSSHATSRRLLLDDLR